MKSGFVAATMMCLIGATMASPALAAFEPLFQITEITGECSVKRPDDKDFEPAVEAKAYPYGTQVRTGARSTAVLVMSKGNTCRVLANALLTMQENVKNPKLRQVFLSEGEVHVKLRKDFNEDGSRFNVETAQAICGAVGTEFRVASQIQDELRVIIIRVIDGEISVTGLFFNIDSLKSNDSLSLIAPMDNAFLRLKNMKGIYNVRLKEGESGERSIETKEGMVLKVWQREVPETGELVVSVSITSPDGKLEETIVAVISKEDREKGGTGEPGDVPTTTTTTRPREGSFPTTTTVTSTTTTTTIKKTPTPSGHR